MQKTVLAIFTLFFVACAPAADPTTSFPILKSAAGDVATAAQALDAAGTGGYCEGILAIARLPPEAKSGILNGGGCCAFLTKLQENLDRHDCGLQAYPCSCCGSDACL